MEQVTVLFIKEFMRTPVKDWNSLKESKLKDISENIKSGKLSKKNASTFVSALEKAYQKVKLAVN